ncbi:Hydroxypyruvate isomerase-like,Xylose isomerase-like, TIM barrel domain [Cinara cedri]|uniref:Putative hydroxypyruvate isomerase n=1 Tax=Cinara cedri TaxID=506608 RepID=A0A5E4MM10_9HEMI|nr:Hydroxypyruvate isomerase-like,Xylose isomerase-like, TIM barrel domain [Cinara cedri]
MNLKFCANLSFMYQETSSLLERYSLAAKSGFSSVECAFPYSDSLDKLVQAKTDANVQQILINVPRGEEHELGFAAIPNMENRFCTSIDLAVSYAQALNCTKIHVMAGTVTQPTEANHKAYLKNLAYAANIFEAKGIIGLIEPINKYSAPGYYLNSYEQAIDVLNKINSPNLKLQLDIFHLQQIKGDLTRNISNLLPYTGHIQLAQVPKRNEPNTPGEIDYKYIFQLLEELNYSEWIGLEYNPKGDTDKGLLWLRNLKETDKF